MVLAEVGLRLMKRVTSAGLMVAGSVASTMVNATPRSKSGARCVGVCARPGGAISARNLVSNRSNILILLLFQLRPRLILAEASW